MLLQFILNLGQNHWIYIKKNPHLSYENKDKLSIGGKLWTNKERERDRQTEAGKYTSRQIQQTNIKM